MTKNENRREFLQKAVMILATLPAAGLALNACTKSPNPADSGGATGATNKLPDGQKPVEETDPVAASLGYKHNADNVDTAKFPKRAGDEGKKQHCENCQYYTGVNTDWGNCQIIRAGLVNKAGWCNTWMQKAGTT
jgi:hypothetical protein